ncbi:MAG: translation initiation factor IF-3 [Verrucomicrobia bacterium]|nr:translation initiation factor IF-3 [Verrucomicrobiota bacterium]
MSRPYSPRSFSSPGSFVRINGKIRAREVRVIGIDGKQLGVITLNEALAQARANGVDLVEIAATATPPVCRLVDFGKYRYEQAKKDKESKKHHHASQVKEVQLSPRIDPHDLGMKVGRAIDFLCEDMKVKVVLKFRGREMAHTEFGFQVVKKFLDAVAAFGHPDFEPKLIGRGINAMVSPLPRNKRAKNPRETGGVPGPIQVPLPEENRDPPPAAGPPPAGSPKSVAARQPPPAFGHNPFATLDLPIDKNPPAES